MLFSFPILQCFWPCGRKFRPRSEQNSDQNSDHPRLRRWSGFLGKENSDHGLSLGCFWIGVDEGALISHSGTKTLRFIKCLHLRFSCVCVFKTLRFETLRFKPQRFSGTQGKRPMRFWGLRAKRSICSCDWRFRAAISSYHRG